MREEQTGPGWLSWIRQSCANPATRSVTPDCKKAGVTFWATVGLIVGPPYILSVGPAEWLVAKIGAPPWAIMAGNVIYAPIWWIFGYGPEWIATPLFAYVSWWRQL